MNYIVKNLVLFVGVVALFMLSFIGAHVFSLDREVLREKTERLRTVNERFSEDLEKTVKKPFAVVSFLAKTSYPAVALDFGMSQQFFDVAREILTEAGMGLALLDRDGNAIATYGVAPGGLEKFRRVAIAGDRMIVRNGHLVYFKAAVSNGDVRGYLAGIQPLEKIERDLRVAYRDVTAGLEMLNPEIVLAASPRDSFPLTVTFRSQQPPLFQPDVNGRWLAAVVVVSLSLLAAFAYLLRVSLKQPLDDLKRLAMRFSRDDPADGADLRLPKDPLFRDIARSLVTMNEKRRELETLKREKEVGLKLQQAAQQVAHDIRSPLAALTMAVSHLQNLPEDARLLVRSAVQRIHDIANDLAGKKAGNAATPEADEPSLQLISGAVDGLLSEKRLQYRAKIGVEIDAKLDGSSYGLFAKIQPAEFKRVLSNLINNAVESIDGSGRVEIRLFRAQDRILLQVSDNGRGIPAEILPRLMHRGETHGKAQGSGLGLFHARTSVEKWGGHITIESAPGAGTTVTIALPSQNPPAWFVPRLELHPGTTVVIADDDQSIHRIWQTRFESFAAAHPVNFVHLSTPDEITNWYRHGNGNAKGTLLLCDYEFVGCEKTGLDVIRELRLRKNAILVTSRFEDDAILRDCASLGVRLIPKNLAAFVPVSINDGNSEPTGHADANPTSESVDAILIDDDELVRTNWKMAARRRNKTIRVYATPEEFWVEAPTLSKDTPIYVDANLAGGIKGEDVTWLMGKKGFSNLHLSTGLEASHFGPMTWLSGIIGKNPPW